MSRKLITSNLDASGANKNDEDSFDKVEEVDYRTKVYLRHLPNGITDEDLINLFSKYGNISKCHVLKDVDIPNLGVVQMSTPEEAQDALKNLHKYCYRGHYLTVEIIDPTDLKGKQRAKPDEMHEKFVRLARGNYAFSQKMGSSWFKALHEEFAKPYFKELGDILGTERIKYTIYPPEDQVYFWTIPVEIANVKVVILGQDPYHGPNQAHGLAFSVNKGVTCPPSLKNIYKELEKDVPGFSAPHHGYLYGWAKQGVLLLNTILTVRASYPNSHRRLPWNLLTDAVIQWINHNVHHTVFILWGKNAQEKKSLITEEKHLVLQAPHPSPLSANKGFFGCRHFSKTNDYLKKHGKQPINWSYLP